MDTSHTSSHGRNAGWPGATVACRRLALAVVLAASCTGCLNFSQPPAKTDFYTLEYDPPAMEALAPLPATLCVNRFSVAPAYNTQKIVYREKPYLQNTYIYHRWRANPGDLLTFFLARDASVSGLFNGAFAITTPHGACTHMVEGIVHEFFELNEQETWSAVTAVGVTLLKTNEPDISKRIVFQRHYREQAPCKRKHPRALAAAMSLAVSRISQAVINDIHAHLHETDNRPEEKGD